MHVETNGSQILMLKILGMIKEFIILQKRNLMDEMQCMENGLIIAGGIIPDSDRETLEDMGGSSIFGPGTSTADIIDFIEEKLS